MRSNTKKFLLFILIMIPSLLIAVLWLGKGAPPENNVNTQENQKPQSQIEVSYVDHGKKLSEEIIELIIKNDFPQIYNSASSMLKEQISLDDFSNGMINYGEITGGIVSYKLDSNYMFNDKVVDENFKNTTSIPLYAYKYEITNSSGEKRYIVLYFAASNQNMHLAYIESPIDNSDFSNFYVGEDKIESIKKLIDDAVKYYNEDNYDKLYSLTPQDKSVPAKDLLKAMLLEDKKIVGKINNTKFVSSDTSLFPPVLLLKYSLDGEKKDIDCTIAAVLRDGKWYLVDIKKPSDK